MKIEEIVTVSSDSLARFNERCKELVNSGYEPFGNIDVQRVAYNCTYTLVFVKYG